MKSTLSGRTTYSLDDRESNEAVLVSFIQIRIEQESFTSFANRLFLCFKTTEQLLLGMRNAIFFLLTKIYRKLYRAYEKRHT